MKQLMILCAAGLSQAAVAQSDTSRTSQLADETAELTAQAARDNAAAAATNAATAKVKAQTDALGIPKIDGKATLGTNGGAIEAWMLSSSVVDKAGQAIAAGVGTALGLAPPPTTAAGTTAQGAPAPVRVLLVSGDEALSLDTAANVSAQIALARRNLEQAQAPLCAPGPSASMIPLAAIGAAANLLKTDTEISGLDVAVTNRMLAAATGKYLRGPRTTVVIPAAAVATSQASPTAQAWVALTDLRDQAGDCLPATPDDKLPDPLKPKVKALKAAIGAVNDLEGKLLKADDKGNTLLGQAVRVDALLQGARPYVLRVNVEKGGGSLLKRSNVWTALGAPAIGITGGLVTSYALTDPYTGELLGSGNVVCRTALTSLRAVQAGVALPAAPCTAF